MALYSPRYSRGYKNCATAEKKLKSLAIFYYGVEVGCPRNNQKNFSVPTKTNRNTICFGCFLVCFAIPKNNFFGLFRCFGSVSKQPKQTDLFRNKPKKTNTMSITGCGPAVLTRRRLCHSCWRNYCTVPIQFSCVVYCMTVWYSTSGSIRNKTLLLKKLQHYDYFSILLYRCWHVFCTLHLCYLSSIFCLFAGWTVNHRLDP
jgi:hypothetical protein